MKKIMKKLIPILLVMLIIASLVWYCFVYDRNFTRDVLLSQARLFSSNGNQKLASWFYDLAYEHSGQDDNVSIELANQFKAEGNYTKAEYTLTNAIADGGSIELYIALCKTYVEQDKLLDAVTMLDTVNDVNIKRQLDAIRPAAPTADPEPGFYTQYVGVGLNCAEGTLYYTTNGEYPSIDDIPYSELFSLPAGETTVLAVTVADNGLVSPLAEFKYTVGGVIEEVSFEDPAVEAEVRSLLGVEDDHVLFTNELWTITSFTVPEGVENFNDLTKLSYLESLTIEGYRLENLQFLTSLTNLDTLVLNECKFDSDEITVIASVPMLQNLTMSDCSLSTIAGLEMALNLTSLNLAGNTIRNLQPLSGLIGLRTIDLSHNALTDLNALSTLVNLEKLNVSYNSLTSISPIAACVNLQWLDVGNNRLTNVDAVAQLAELEYLYANNNSLTYVSPIGNCLSLIELDISRNSVTDIRTLATLIKLESLNFARNQVTELPPWPDGSALRIIDGSHNLLTDISSLKNMMELSHVYMDYNQITDISALADCYKLVMVNVYGNDVTGVEALTEHDIIVNYNPT